MENRENNKELSLELGSDVAKGTYANLAVITHSPSEFVLDFAAILPGTPKALVNSRIIMTPEHTKRLLQALTDNVAKYENQFGQIELPENKMVMPMGFGPNTPNA